MRSKPRIRPCALLLGMAFATCALADESGLAPLGQKNLRPRWLGPVSTMHYDGIVDDLLTAGLGKDGLANPVPPPLSSPPTAAELRRLAIHTNYRAIVDTTTGGGYGSLYGPNLDAGGQDTLGQGLIAGAEHIAYSDDGSGRQNVTLMVQVPDSFDPAKACIVTATSSGSRGVYGAIGAVGEWGLKRGCAVAYTDKGTGNGLHDLAADTVNLVDGTRTSAASAGTASHFTANLSGAELAAFNAAFPDRVAYKHAHSQQNPEKDWGRHTLQAVKFAFWVLNERWGTELPNGAKKVALDKRNTLVIASSVSNGGGAAVAAAEQDVHGLIDAVAVSEPNVQPRDNDRLTIMQGGTVVGTHSRPLLDYFTYANIYQPCAALAPAAAGSPAALFLGIPNAAGAANRCAALSAKGLVSGATLIEQASDALARLHDYGWSTEHDVLHASHYRFATNAIAVTYGSTYGRFGVQDNLCGYSFANTGAGGVPVPQNPALQAGIFGTGNGIPPTTGVNIVYNDSSDGARLDLLGRSASTGLADFALDGALCHRALVTGVDPVTGAPLSGALAEQSQRVRKGIAEVLLTGKLRGKPAIIVAGRSDTLVPVNHAARAYFGKNQMAEGAGHGRLRYIEVTNAQHFDAFIAAPAVFAGYDSRFVPLHVYLNRALDAVWNHVTENEPLPPSQVVRTIPRGGAPGAAPAITPANVPGFKQDPGADRIVFERKTLYVPD